MEEGAGRPRVLVVDDEPEVCNFFRHLLQGRHDVSPALSGGDALRELERRRFDLALVDLKLPDSDGLTLLKRIKADQPSCEVIIMTGYSTVKSAVEAIQLGAYDYVEKPFDEIDELEGLIEKALDLEGRVRTWESIDEKFGFVVGNNYKVRRLIAAAEKLAKKNVTVLLQGETGTGKEVMARFIHSMSHRASEPFIAVNCGAFTETLLESELFGHEKGSFTGASSRRRGIFEIANGGTLLLDEIGAASLSIQVKLLRVLETNEFIRVGGEKPLKTDVRIIAATNTDLREEVEAGKFREDLFYRLDVAALTLPPLRERAEDVPLFASYFLKKVSSSDSGPLRFAPETLEIMQRYSWPGNIRELQNVVTQAATLCDGPVILPRHLPSKLLNGVGGRRTGAVGRGTAPAAGAPAVDGDPGTRAGARAGAGERAGDLDALFAQFERRIEEAADPAKGADLPALMSRLDDFETRVARRIIESALRETMGDRRKAAEMLGITPRRLRYLLREKK